MEGMVDTQKKRHIEHIQSGATGFWPPSISATWQSVCPLVLAWLVLLVLIGCDVIDQPSTIPDPGRSTPPLQPSRKLMQQPKPISCAV
jgi:hypothetical protein